jgi:hypothetical protein
LLHALHIEQSGVPIYVQIRDQVLRAIGAGIVKPGERMPTMRQVASTPSGMPTTLWHELVPSPSNQLGAPSLLSIPRWTISPRGTQHSSTTLPIARSHRREPTGSTPSKPRNVFGISKSNERITDEGPAHGAWCERAILLSSILLLIAACAAGAGYHWMAPIAYIAAVLFAIFAILLPRCLMIANQWERMALCCANIAPVAACQDMGGRAFCTRAL